MFLERLQLTFIILGQLTTTSAQRKHQLNEEQRRSFEKQGVSLDEISEDTIFLTPPELTDEDHGSKFMPQAYRCDGCRGVAYQLKKRFAAAEKKKPGNDKLSYVEVVDIVDELCKDKFENYGLKSVLGQNKLSGEGLDAESASGVLDTGGVWEKRMQRICDELVGEYEEDGIYGMYEEEQDNFSSQLCVDYCRSKKHRKTEL